MRRSWCIVALFLLQRAILQAGPKAAEDFDMRTALYRQIFSFVMTHAGTQVCVAWLMSR